MEWAVLLLSILSIVLVRATGVAALTNNSDIIGMAVAGCASFALLTVVVGLLIASCNWKPWFSNWMRQQGKIRMPEAYFKKKKIEAQQRLISRPQQVRFHQVNGHLPRPVDREKLVQGWRQGNPRVTKRIYEEKDATVELSDEVDDEYKIETEVVDNEILDVGPFKHDHSREIPIKGDVYTEPYIFTTVGSTKLKSAGVSVGNSVKPSRHSSASPVTIERYGRSVGNSVKPSSDFRTSPAAIGKSGRSVGNSVNPSNDFRTSTIVNGKSGRSVGNSVKPPSDFRTPPAAIGKSGRSVGNSVKPSNDPITSPVVNGMFDRGVGNSVKPSTDFRTSPVTAAIDRSGRSVSSSVKPSSNSSNSPVSINKSGRSVDNSVKLSSDHRASAVVTKSFESAYYTAGAVIDNKFDEGLLYM
ncbi:hypothetical protein BsWGS_06576 [Bradybaena similaris]